MLFYIPLLAGIVGTVLMTWFTSAAFRMLKDPYKVVWILGNMIMFRPYTPVTKQPTSGSFAFAVCIHYVVGVLFSFAYRVLIVQGYWPFHFAAAVLYGCIIGSVGVVGWKLFLRLHPAPPFISQRHYLWVIWWGHLVLAIAMFLTFKIFIST